MRLQTRSRFFPFKRRYYNVSLMNLHYINSNAKTLRRKDFIFMNTENTKETEVPCFSRSKKKKGSGFTLFNVNSTNCLISSKLLFLLLKIATNCQKIFQK